MLGNTGPGYTVKVGISTSPADLGMYTLTEAEFPLRAGTEPVDRAPYRTNPR